MNFRYFAFAVAILFWVLAAKPTLADLDDGLVAYYPFNGNANDESGNGNHGIVYGATLTQDRFGNNDRAYQFDGLDDYISIPDTNIIDFALSDDFSVIVWVKVISLQADTGNTDNDIVEKWIRSSGYPYVIRYLNQKDTKNHGKIIVLRYDGYNNPSITGTIAINDDQFHQISFVKNSSTLYLYIDGILNGTTTDTTTGNTTNNSNLFLGRRGDGGLHDNYFGGTLDELRIYNRALSAEEIQQLYDLTPLDEAKEAGRQECRINPESCGINIEGGTTVCATYTLEGSLHIPSVQVPAAFPSLLPQFYEVDMQLIPLSDPFQFTLTSVKLVGSQEGH